MREPAVTSTLGHIRNEPIFAVSPAPTSRIFTRLTARPTSAGCTRVGTSGKIWADSEALVGSFRARSPIPVSMLSFIHCRKVRSLAATPDTGDKEPARTTARPWEN